jgi:hypothetical protein
VRLEHRLEAPALAVAGKALQPSAHAPDPPGLDDRDEDEDEDRGDERDDDPAEVRRDGGVEIDRTNPPTGEMTGRDGDSILARGLSRGITRR